MCSTFCHQMRNSRYVLSSVSTGTSWKDRKYDKDQIMWIVFAQVFGFLNDNRKAMGTLVGQGNPKEEIKQNYSCQKPWTFAAGSISHGHFGLPVTQLYSKTNKQTKCCIGKRSLPYICCWCCHRWMHIQNKYQLVTNSHSTFSSARRLSVSSGMDMLTFSILVWLSVLKEHFCLRGWTASLPWW